MRLLHKLINKRPQNLYTNLLIAVAVAVGVATTGFLLSKSGAAGFFAGTESEQATLSGNASLVSDAGASGGQAIAFNAPTPPPPPPPSGGVTCTGAAHHVPDGPDGTGTCWPGPLTTGVPAGTTLTNYTGSCTIQTANTVIENKHINCRLNIRAAGIIVRNSTILGVTSDSAFSGSVQIEHSEIDGGNDDSYPAVGYHDITLIAVNLHGGQHNYQCDNNCTITDSWLHDTYLGATSGAHENGFISNGGHDCLLRHNSLECNRADNGHGGGCTAATSLFGDFDAISRFTFDHNLYVSPDVGSYCAYGGSGKSGRPDRVVFTNNIFQKGPNGHCGYYGPITAFDPARPGNVWTNNKYDDGTVVNSSL